MKFEFIRNMIIVPINDRKYLIDTGCGLSFSLVGENIDVVINDTTYHLKPHYVAGKTNEALAHLMPGQKIDGIIGLDIMSQTNLSIDYLNQDIYFDLVKPSYDIERFTIPFEINMGHIYIDLKLKAGRMQAILDSGAEIGFVKSKYINLEKPIDEYDDYSPELGQMRGKIYLMDEPFNGDGLRVGILPERYEPFCDGILSLYDLVRPGFCSFNFELNLLEFTRRFL